MAYSSRTSTFNVGYRWVQKSIGKKGLGLAKGIRRSTGTCRVEKALFPP